MLHYNPHNESQFFVAPHLMTLIKPHPVLVNVERKHVDYLNVAEVKLDGVSTSFAIVASRDILAGEEFFSDYNGWLRNDDHDMMNVANLSIFFSAVPLSNHYERADAIVKDLISSVKPVSPRKRKMNQIEDRVAESLPVHSKSISVSRAILSYHPPIFDLAVLSHCINYLVRCCVMFSSWLLRVAKTFSVIAQRIKDHRFAIRSCNG